MALDPRYVPLTTIWQLFTDKDTGEFLRNGYVKFWVDTARTVGKPVYQLTGSPPNYTYIEYGQLDPTDGAWVVDINDQGALDAIPYGFPYDEDGNVQLYFIQVFASDGATLQFTREGWPNITGATPDNTTEVPVNFVPNPQFLLHLDLPETDTFDAGQVRSAVTDIAWGGWTYQRPNSSTATDYITFDRFGSDVTTPEKSPRYALRVECETPSPGDTYKDIRLKFRDVNKFSSDTDYFTFAFYAQVNAGSSLQASIILIKNYGTGGSAPTETVLGTVNIGSSWALYPVSFIFGENTSKTIGTLDDDYLELVIRLPVAVIFDVSFDSFDLAKGQIATPSMPYTTDSQMIYRSLAGFMPIPDPDGSDLYLPVRLTPTGMEFDHSGVGMVYSCAFSSAPTGYLDCNGQQIEYNGYSSDLVPYSRLGNKLWDNTLNNYYFGNGSAYVTSQITNSSTSTIKLNTNTAGAVSNPADGTAPTGFTFSPIHTGSTAYNFTSNYSSDGVFVKRNVRGGYTASTDGTSGFTVTDIRNDTELYGLTTIEVNAVPAAGTYFTIYNTTQGFYVWFKVGGSGSDPAPGGGLTGIEVDIPGTFNAVDVAQCIAEVLSGFQNNLITTVAASAITAGDWWSFNTLATDFYVWYKKDNAGTDPAPSGRMGIQVDILSADTAAQVATKTVVAINKKYYAVPDLRGMFIRGTDAGRGLDPDVLSRFNLYSNSFGDEVGTIEYDDIVSHSHPVSPTLIGDLIAGTEYFAGSSIPGTTPGVLTVGYAGGIESRPINIYLNYVIKY